MKYFIITIDTEGDNLWNWKNGEKITTENSIYLDRFQKLCNRFRFKPVWLSNYEMLNDQRYVDFIKNVIKTDSGECGMHLHAWNTPPIIELPVGENPGTPFLIEYPRDIMNQKIITMTRLIKEKVGVTPVSHRAGRWVINNDYLELLKQNGYVVDCSVTPGIDWSKTRGQSPNSYGNDYSIACRQPYYVFDNFLEVPVTITKSRRFFWAEDFKPKAFLKKLYHYFSGEAIWLRPDGKNLKKMLSLVEQNKDSDYLMFMLHSSELMPGGSPTFKSKEAIEKLYFDLEKLFLTVSQEYVGITLADYVKVRNSFDCQNKNAKGKS